MKLSSTPASKLNIPEAPVEGHMEPEGSSTSKGPLVQPDLQARNNCSRRVSLTNVRGSVSDLQAHF